MKHPSFHLLILNLLLLITPIVCCKGEVSAVVPEKALNRLRIQPYSRNPAYWQFRGKPLVLIGGSVEDNLFQIDNLEEHLDLLKGVGGNYVRCTMSSRDQDNVWPFEFDQTKGRYDLDRPNPEYWTRFSEFLSMTEEREIIVQIEVWATFDFYDGVRLRRPYWQKNPFNPMNNTNYTASESGLHETVASHPTATENPFFWSVPQEDDNPVALRYQQAFVNELLSHSLSRTNVIYCIDNETSVTPKWGEYWAGYILEAAACENLSVEVTEMWDPWDLSDEMHENTFSRGDLYSFVDISQNNHQVGEAHWENAQKQRLRIQKSGRIRPLNNVKIYGADSGRFGSDRDGVERFWRNIIGGLASARFHRPQSGLGLGAKARVNIKSMRLLLNELNFAECTPHNELISNREENEAYCTARPGHVYSVFFPHTGDVVLDVSAAAGRDLGVRWLNILAGKWTNETRISAVSALNLTTPTQDYWTVLVEVLEQ